MPTIDFANIIAAKLNGQEVVRITDTVNTLWELQQPATDFLSFTDQSNAANTLTLSRVGSNPSALGNVYVEYSFDKSTWTPWTESSNTRTLTIPAGETVYLRGTNSVFNISTDDNYYAFSSTGNVAAGGDVKTLVAADGTVTALPNYFCRCMFKGMTTLTKAPAIGVLTLGQSSCRAMFDGCTNLTDVSLVDFSSVAIGNGSCYWMFRNTAITAAPTLTVTSTQNTCCYGMFTDCSSMTTAANVHLNAVTLLNYSYGEMFRGCSSLVTPPSFTQSAINANGVQCLSNMFRDCTSLTATPTLTIGSFDTTQRYHCSAMFYGCTSLVDATGLTIEAPALGLGTLKSSFEGCTALTAAPEIQATTLADGNGDQNNGSLAYMFRNCSSLAHIKVAFTDWDSDAATNNLYAHNWVSGVAQSGVFECPSALPVQMDTNHIPTGWTIQYTDSQKGRYFSINDESGAANTIKLIGSSGSVEASSDNGTTWNEITASSAGTEISLPANGKVLFKHTGDMSGMKFNATADYSVWGNIDSLIHGDNFGDGGTSGGFDSVFDGSAKLVSAENLYIGYTTVGNSKMRYMFRNCTGLVTPPSLEKITALAENSPMQSMFQGCSAMTTPPNMSGLTNLSGVWASGMRDMFRNCTSLASPADLSGVTTLGDRTCNGMYYGCTSLEEPSDMPLLVSVSSNSSFNQMYYGCTALKRVPDLHSLTSLGSGNSVMYGMFQGCTSLRRGLDISGITTASGSTPFDDMYTGCSNIFEVWTPNISNWIMPTDGWKNNFGASYGVYHIMQPLGSGSSLKSNWIAARTASNDSTDSDYFTVSMKSWGSNNHIYVFGNDSETIDYSDDNGTTWNTITPASGNGTPISVGATAKVLFRHVGDLGGNIKFGGAYSSAFAVSGNIDSLINGDNFVQSGATMPTSAFQDLFAESSKLVSAEHLYLGAYDTVSELGMATMFSECTHLLKAPDCSHFTEIGQQGMDGLLNDEGLFRNCKCLAEGVDISNVESVGWRGLFCLNGGCSVMDKAYLPNLEYKDDVDWWSLFGGYMENNYPSGTMYADASWQGYIPMDDTNIVPSGWNVEYTGDVKPNAVSSNGYVTATPMNQGDSVQYKIGNGEWTAYTAPIAWGTIGANNTVYFREIKDGTAYSGNSSVTPTVQNCATPRISNTSGTTVAITADNDSYAGASIYYTTDGTNPTASSTLYTAPFTAAFGTTVKAISVPSNTTWYAHSDVASLVVTDVANVSYVYNTEMEGSPSIHKCIDTGITLTNTMKFRIEGEDAGYGNGLVWVGNMAERDVEDYDDSYALRVYCVDSLIQSDWGGSDYHKDAWYDYGQTMLYDLTFDRTSCYDNIAESYLWDDGDGNYTGSTPMNCLVDVTAVKFTRLRIWDTVNGVETLIFDGKAAVKSGIYGIYDTVSGTLLTNSNITMTGE